MTLLRIFQSSPFAGLTFLFCCATILLAIQMVRQTRWREDRFIAGFVGLLALHQAFSVLKDAGLVPQQWRQAEDLVGAIIASLFLIALLVLRTHLWNIHNQKMRLRISEMNMGKPKWTPEEIEAIECITRKPAPARSIGASAAGAPGAPAVPPSETVAQG
jgi:cytochrome c biogenesis factor